jgi:hypothetical protein
MARIRIEEFCLLAQRFKVASDRLVECDLRDPLDEFPDIRLEVRQELHEIESDTERAGYSFAELFDYAVTEEE